MPEPPADQQSASQPVAPPPGDAAPHMTAEPMGAPTSDAPGWWRRRSRRAKIAIIVGCIVLGIGVVDALGGSGGSSNATPSASSPDATSSPTSEPSTTPPDSTTPATTSDAPPKPSAPKPIVLKGVGSKVTAVALQVSTPLVVTGSNSGSSNFIAELHPRSGGSSQLLFNEIGPYQGQTAWADAHKGKYRLSIEAAGSWRVILTQPVPRTHAQALPGTIKGTGARVIPVQTTSDLAPVVTGRNSGDSNFIVDLVGYGPLVSGDQLVFNEIGPFSGQTLIDSVPQGAYLLVVQAKGRWTIRVSR